MVIVEIEQQVSLGHIHSTDVRKMYKMQIQCAPRTSVLILKQIYNMVEKMRKVLQTGYTALSKNFILDRLSLYQVESSSYHISEYTILLQPCGYVTSTRH